MTNADKFKTIFGMYSEEFWAKPEDDMLNWINSEYQEPKSKANVQPVKHGEWIHTGGKFSRNKNVDRRILTCSICGNMLSMEGVNAGRGDANYCPNCGAKMDGEN